jgi:hypothetical protein
MLALMDVLSLVPILLGFNFGQSESQQQQESGLDPETRWMLATRGRNLAAQFDPILLNRVTATPPSFPALGPTGLYPQQEQAFNTAVTQGFSKSSADFARQGMLRPEAIGAIAGSAARDVLPQFLGLIGQNVQQGVMAPELIQQQRTNQFTDFLRTLLGVQGGTGAGSGSAFNFGLSWPGSSAGSSSRGPGGGTG